MPIQFTIRSSDAVLLEKARRVAREFAGRYATPGTVGIVFLGALPRGYFDASADIDVAVFTARGHSLDIAQFQHVEGMEIHTHPADYEAECDAEWSMPKRWTFSQAEIYHDPHGKVAELLREKVPLKADERRWLLMSGVALSEWYINRLSQLWVERGNLMSAHHMFDKGLDYFMDMLYGLNDELVADTKWKYYCLEQLGRLPEAFREHMQAAMQLKEFSPEELERRRNAFMEMWQQMLPEIESEVGMSYAEIVNVV